MIESIKHFINSVTNPKVIFPTIIVIFFFIFPPTDWLYAINRRLRLYTLWSKRGGIVIFSLLILFFAFGLTDQNFRLIVTKPDNVPIVGLIFLTIFFVWLSMHQATANDELTSQGKKPNEAEDAKEKILVWPDLVFIELICLILAAALLIFWSIMVKAPLEEAANPAISPNPSKAPWYFLGLQEMLVYFDPWIAGVLFPTIIIFGMMSIPFIDNNPRGCGYYSFKERKMAVAIFLFCWLALWIFLIMTGTFLRGPNWNFFGPFEYWDVHKLAALTNVNLSEIIYMKLMNKRLPDNIFLREMYGFLVLGFYFGMMPLILAKTIFSKVYQRLGPLRYSIFVILLLLAMSLPIKMFLRWSFNIKYIVAIPEFFFNI